MDVKAAIAANNRALAMAAEQQAGRGKEYAVVSPSAAVNVGTAGGTNAGPTGADIKGMANDQGDKRRAAAAASAASSYEAAEADLSEALAMGGEGNLPPETPPLEKQSAADRRRKAADLTKPTSAYEE